MAKELNASQSRKPRTVKAKTGRKIEQAESIADSMTKETKRVAKLATEAKFNKLNGETDPEKRKLIINGIRSDLLGTTDLLKNMEAVMKSGPGSDSRKVVKKAHEEAVKLSDAIVKVAKSISKEESKRQGRQDYSVKLGKATSKAIGVANMNITNLKDRAIRKSMLVRRGLDVMNESRKYAKILDRDLALVHDDGALNIAKEYFKKIADTKTKDKAPTAKETTAIANLLHKIVVFKDKASFDTIYTPMGKRTDVPVEIIEALNVRLGKTGRVGNSLTFEGLREAVKRNIDGNKTSGAWVVDLQPSDEFFKALEYIKDLSEQASQIEEELIDLEKSEDASNPANMLPEKVIVEQIAEKLKELEPEINSELATDLVTNSQRLVSLLETDESAKDHKIDPPEPVQPDQPDGELALLNGKGIKEKEAPGGYAKGKAIRHALRAMGVPEHDLKIVLTSTGLFKKSAVKSKYDSMHDDSKKAIEALFKYERTYPNRKLTLKLLKQHKVFIDPDAEDSED